MPTEPQAGEVWFADLGMAEKCRPVLVLAFPGDDDARSAFPRYQAGGLVTHRCRGNSLAWVGGVDTCAAKQL